MRTLNAPGGPRIVVIDGRSGSGKTSLAAEVAAELGAEQLHLEDLYPGWDGLAAGASGVAEALRRGEYRRYDWHAGAFAESRRIDPGRPLVIEGCGAVTASNLRAARRFAGRGARLWSVWLECPVDVRRTRALGRESEGGGAAFAPHWDAWAAAEDAHFRAELPFALANEIRHTG